MGSHRNLIICLLFIFNSCIGQSVRIGPDVYINTDAILLKDRVQLPDGFVRPQPDDDSFAYFLQNFPLKPHRTEVYFYSGKKKYSQNGHLAVLDIDTGDKNLQQCADAVIRLRAEYLYHHQRYEDIQFNFTNGFPASYMQWRSGQRIQVKGNDVSWYNTEKASESYASFRKYLDVVFMYAGTLSLNQELKAKPLEGMEIGDVFIQGGSPGHAMIVVDMAIHQDTLEKIFLLAQSYMPAQDIHIVKKTRNFIYGPWYSVSEIKETLRTPEWTFYAKDLKSF